MTRALLLLAWLGSGCAMGLEGELPDVEIARHGVVIPGVPAEAGLGDSAVTVTVTVNPRDHIDVDPDTYRSVKVHQVIFSSTGADLSFLRSLDLTMNGAARAASPIPVLHYQHDPEAAAVGSTLTLPVDPPVEVVGAWKDPPSTIGLQVRGELPTTDWTLDVSVHLSATIGY